MKGPEPHPRLCMTGTRELSSWQGGYAAKPAPAGTQMHPGCQGATAFGLE